MRRLIVFIFVFLVAITAHAEELLMVRSHQKFPEAMSTLQNALDEHGYTVTRVQRVDVGLTGMGYRTDKYRVVFFGKTDEIHYLTKKYPVLIPYLPPKISIFAENEETVLVTAKPVLYEKMIHNKKDEKIFHRWQKDFQAVFDEVRNTE
jgi:uncharacterized protein (DUF302 family)